ncbi:hypothetical protein PT974_09500 [Cladobotryum mycophilum]|uniref:Uncharacterized protein n=1 Tax=Cladobotryum mycophilum TaxID=491253 RepID=A0ABR0SGB3_9HYPO
MCEIILSRCRSCPKVVKVTINECDKSAIGKQVCGERYKGPEKIAPRPCPDCVNPTSLELGLDAMSQPSRSVVDKVADKVMDKTTKGINVLRRLSSGGESSSSSSAAATPQMGNEAPASRLRKLLSRSSTRNDLSQQVGSSSELEVTLVGCEEPNDIHPAAIDNTSYASPRPILRRLTNLNKPLPEVPQDAYDSESCYPQDDDTIVDLESPQIAKRVSFREPLFDVIDTPTRDACECTCGQQRCCLEGWFNATDK